MVLISLVDSDRLWFKSACGLQIMEPPREISFCAHLLTTRQPLLVPDALLDERFCLGLSLYSIPCRHAADSFKGMKAAILPLSHLGKSREGIPPA
jgi:hypothetical protein